MSDAGAALTLTENLKGQVNEQLVMIRQALDALVDTAERVTKGEDATAPLAAARAASSAVRALS
jgi:hypothetical protein